MDIVPIRLDVEQDGYHFQDTFTWISPTDNNLIETFVDQLCHDFDLPPQIMKIPLVKSIKEQIVDFNTFSSSSGKFTLPNELKTVRILVKLDVICDLVWLTDQFEWEPFNGRNVAEDFASLYCNELKLPGEFRSAVAHAIREQSFLFLKALLSTGYRVDPEKSGIGSIQFNDSEVADCAISSPGMFGQKNRLLRTPDLLDTFTPRVASLTEDELEKLLYSRKRENRRKKRSTLNVSSPPKTHRTFLGYRGSLNRTASSSDYDDDGNLDRRTASSRRIPRKGSAPSTASGPSGTATSRPTLCDSCDNSVYPADQGICSKCGHIVSPNGDNVPYPLQAVPDRKHQTEKSLSNTSKRGRKPLPLTPISYPVPIPPGPKVDPEPLSEELQKLLPEWLVVARKKLDEKYPLDLFCIVYEDDEPRMKCIECSKMYYPGPAQTLSNFETHLKNRSHRGNVDWRLEHPDEEEEEEEGEDEGMNNNN